MDTYEIVDYTQYRLYLDKANKDKNPIWEVAYTFKNYYDLEKADFNSARKIRDQFYVTIFY